MNHLFLGDVFYYDVPKMLAMESLNGTNLTRSPETPDHLLLTHVVLTTEVVVAF